MKLLKMYQYIKTVTFYEPRNSV